MSCLFQKDRFFFAGKELVYYNENTLISESHTAKGFHLEQDAIILVKYTSDSLKTL